MYHFFAATIGLWGQIGVDVFIIISVYFLRQSNRFRSYKAIDLILETIFYGVFWSIIVINFVKKISVKEILVGTFSLFVGNNWFVFAYILIYIYHPILNMIIRLMSDSQLKKVVLIMTITIAGLKTIYHGIAICDFLFMINVYFIICYIERNKLSLWFTNNAKTGVLICSFILFTVHMILVIVGTILDSSFILSHSYYLNLRGSIYVLVDALFLFYFVSSCYPRYSKVVNIISSTCFGVFLSHQFLGYKFWYKLLFREGLNNIQASLHMILSIVIIFLSCAVIDIVRQYTIGKMYKKIIEIKSIKKALDRMDMYINDEE